MIYFLNIVLICSLSANALWCNPIADSALLDTETRYDLDLIASERNTLSIFFDKTITKGGHHELISFLMNPTDDIDLLCKRQGYLRDFLEHADLASSLRHELQGLAAYEPAPKEPVTDHLGEKALERVYFSLPQLKHYNTNPYALDVAYGMHITSMCAPLAEHIILHLGIEFLAHSANDHDHVHHHHHAGCSHSHAHLPAGTSNLVYYGLQSLHWGLHLPGLYDMACDIQERALMIKYVQTQTIRVAEYVSHAKNMHALLRKSAADLTDFGPLAQLEYFFAEKPACSENFQKLLNLLQTSTFHGEASVWSHVGNVLAAYKLYNNVQDEFECLTKAVSEIDVYLSTASFIEKQTEREPWCFVALSEDEKPKLIVENVRHLFIVNGKAADFSSDRSLRRIVTGDNGSGKSTYLMSIGHAIVLAQTFGIAPAIRCEMTPFSHIYTFRFVRDNMVEGTSRFYAECARVGKIIDTIADDAKHSCIILDEPFAHTTAEKGACYLQKSLAEIGALNNAISLIATHYHDLGPEIDELWNVEQLPVRARA